MKDLLDKLGSYNVFNYLLPGVVFVYSLQTVTAHNLINSNIVIGAFVYYFLGLIISRTGSLILDPVLKNLGFIKFSSYQEFVAACKVDSKIEVFSEINNMYRTFCAMFLLIATVRLYDIASISCPVLTVIAPYVLIIALLILFLFSYKKQTEYIKKRIAINNK